MTAIPFERPRLYPKQEAALFAPERYSIIEASTKSGKTVGCIAWLLEQAILHGRAGRHYWWIAPTLPVAKIAFRRMKRALRLHRPLFTVNDSDCSITLLTAAGRQDGPTIWFKGADRPDSLYGEDVYAAVIDEASRCKQDAWVALRSTLTATRGPVRIIGNVKGRHNWAYRLARKAESGAKDMAFFRLTADDAIQAGIFDAAEVADAQDVMPADVFRELYYAEATDDGSNPFGMAAIAACCLPELDWKAVVKGLQPVAWGWDFARAQDWTVGIGLDRDYKVTEPWHRWQRVPWGETYARVTRFTGSVPAWGDSTGVGDAVVESIAGLGCPMDGVMFTPKEKQRLMERLAGAIQQKKLLVPDGTIRTELESMEYDYRGRDGDFTGVRYAAPEGMHDDAVMALALAVFGRDQFGALGLPVGAEVRERDQHPGLDRTGHRLKRFQPQEPEFSYHQPRPPKPGRPTVIR